jgi:hypothetical protein
MKKEIVLDEELDEPTNNPRAGLKENDLVTIRVSRRHAAMAALDLTAYGHDAGTESTFVVPVDSPVQPTIQEAVEAWLLERLGAHRTYGGAIVCDDPKFTRSMIDDLAKRISALTAGSGGTSGIQQHAAHSERRAGGH